MQSDKKIRNRHGLILNELENKLFVDFMHCSLIYKQGYDISYDFYGKSNSDFYDYIISDDFRLLILEQLLKKMHSDGLCSFEYTLMNKLIKNKE